MDPVTQPVQQTPPMGVPSQSPQQPRKGANPFIIMFVMLLSAVVGSGAYLYFHPPQKESALTAAKPTPTPIVLKQSVSGVPNATGSGEINGMGTVTGEVCYPASVVPPGTIYAKNLQTGKEVTQAYLGSQVAKSLNYTLHLPAGMYHMKFVAEMATNIIGYYTEYSTCVDTPSEPNCSGNKTNAILPVHVTVGQIIPKINLCDYYYTPETAPKY